MPKQFSLSIIYFIIVTAIGIYFKLSIFYILLIFPLVLINKEWILTFILVPSLLKDGLSKINTVTGEPISLIPLGILTVLLLLPLFLNNTFKNNINIPKRYLQYFILFIILILFGFIVYSIKFNIDENVLKENIILIIKFIFLILFFNFLLSKNLIFIENSLKLVLKTTIPVIIILIIYNLTIGKSQSINEQYLDFGNSKHGEYTAILTAFSIYTFYSFWNRNYKLIYKIFFAVVLIFTYFTILQMGSRNGMVSFAIMLIAGFFIFSYSRSYFKKIIVVLIGVIFIGIIILINIDTILQTPTVTRTLLLLEKRGVEESRTNQLEAALKAFPDSPVFGWGSSGKASYYVANHYGGVDNVMHNIILDLFARHGMIGVIFYLSFLVLVFKRGKTIYYYCFNKKDWLLFIPVFSLGIMLFSGMFVPWLWQMLIWYNAILVLSTFETIKKEQKPIKYQYINLKKDDIT